MNIEVFDPLPARLFERLVSFSQSTAGHGWRDVYRMLSHLSEHCPGVVFRDEPYFYLDLKTKRSGLLFVEQESERLYFVYDSGARAMAPHNPGHGG